MNNDNYLNIISDLVFSYLIKTNYLLIVNDKDDMFFHTFFNKYKVCHIRLIGSPFESIPYKIGYSVTNLNSTVKEAYMDGALNSPVDVLYLDLSTSKKFTNQFENVISDNTITILRYSSPMSICGVPDFIKTKYTNYMTDCIQIGDYDKEHHYHNSSYYLVFF